jgi:hypothetical protein
MEYIWVTKGGWSAFRSKRDALDYLKGLRFIAIADRAERKEKAPSKIVKSNDGNKYYFTFGCNSRAIRKVILQ